MNAQVYAELARLGIAAKPEWSYAELIAHHIRHEQGEWTCYQSTVAGFRRAVVEGGYQKNEYRDIASMDEEDLACEKPLIRRFAVTRILYEPVNGTYGFLDEETVVPGRWAYLGCDSYRFFFVENDLTPDAIPKVGEYDHDDLKEGMLVRMNLLQFLMLLEREEK